MERRAEVRLRAEVSVNIAGIDANGRAYRQTVSVRSVSLSGGLLTGVQQQLRCGDLIVLQRDSKIARFRVIWLRDSLVAVQKLADDPCLWQELLGKQPSGSTPQASSLGTMPPKIAPEV